MNAGEQGARHLGWAVDCHVHSSCSWDGVNTPDDYCRRAMELGLGGVVFTDHVELDPLGKGYRRYDYGLARALVDEARGRYPGLYVGLGVEVTYLDTLEPEIRAFLRGKSFDMVLGSLHQVQGLDCSDPATARAVAGGGVDVRALLNSYFAQLRSAVESGLFDVLGHVDVFLRLGRECWRGPAAEMAERMGEVLDRAVAASVAIEVNTSGLRLGVGHPHPGEQVLQAYLARGGRLVTLGSDAHQVEHLAWRFPEVVGRLAEMGFPEVCFFRDRQPVRVPLPVANPGAGPQG